MVAAVDIGNSNIHCGLFQGRRLRKKIVYPLIHKNVVNRVIRELRREEIKGAAISSVVPSFTYRFAKLLQHNFGVLPIIVSAKTASFLQFDYYRPETLGADRIANAVGGLARYRKNLIIIDFGTAVTFDVVLRNGRYLGGIIVPGALASLDSLVRQTALLKPVPYKEKATLIGRSTEECIQSGIFNGTVAMVSGLVRFIQIYVSMELWRYIIIMSRKGDKFITESVEETIALGKEVAQRLNPGDVVYLYGELGSGKTVFVKGVCQGLEVDDEITSPSFVIATEYQGRLPVSHIDLYRLDPIDVLDMHIEEYFSKSGVTLIEWADRLKRRGGEGMHIKIRITGPNRREFEKRTGRWM